MDTIRAFGSSFNILDFGADPSGKRSSTQAIQNAVDAAGSSGQGGLVVVPPGCYLVSDIQMHPAVTLQGCAAWGYKRIGSCVLKLDPLAENPVCLLNLTNAFSCAVKGIEFVGDGPLNERTVHGIYIHHDKIGREGGQTEEDIPTIEDCKIGHFSGDCIHFHNVWCFQIRSTQLIRGRNGLYLKAVDGFINEVLFTSNRGWGLYADPDGGHNAMFQVSGCRVEWNRAGGFYLSSARSWQLVNNSFDRNYGPALACVSSGHKRLPHTGCITVMGNIFNRNGVEQIEDRSCHLLLDDCYSTTITGNVFIAGAQDNLQGEPYPHTAIVLHNLKSVVIANNTLKDAATHQLLLDHGGHYIASDPNDSDCGYVWQNNPGSIAGKSCYHTGGYFSPSRD